MTNTSRRNLLQAVIVGTVLVTTAPAGNAAAGTTADLYSRARFKRRVAATFRLSGATGTWYVRLDGVSDLTGSPKGADNAFRLAFSSSTGPPPQGTYTLRGSGFEATPLFVVPGDPANGSLSAVINRTV